jgi:tRNA threonylcarbamoyladenosine biosynthesis protein TsaB
MILALKTDQPQAVVCVLDTEGTELARHEWHAHRTLAHDLLSVIRDQLQAAGGSWQDITGLVFFAGPGSFTGLRIGASVANTIAHENQAPIVGVGGEDWLSGGMCRIKYNENDKLVLPEYGAPPNITKQKK